MFKGRSDLYPIRKKDPYKIYNEALEAMKTNDYFYANTKFEGQN